jgi:hypothetical protein
MFKESIIDHSKQSGWNFQGGGFKSGCPSGVAKLRGRSVVMEPNGEAFTPSAFVQRELQAKNNLPRRRPFEGEFSLCINNWIGGGFFPGS